MADERAWVDETVVPYLQGDSERREPPRLFEVANGRVVEFIYAVLDRWLAPLYMSVDPKNDRARLEHLSAITTEWLTGLTRAQPQSIQSLLSSILSPTRLRRPRDDDEALARELIAAAANRDAVLDQVLNDASQPASYPGVVDWMLTYIGAMAEATVKLDGVNPGIVLQAYLAIVYAAWHSFAGTTEHDQASVVQMHVDGTLFPGWGAPMRAGGGLRLLGQVVVRSEP